MATLDSPTKVCSRCGEDCSHKQRAKDAQGRYICQDCLDKARAAAKAAPASPPKAAAPKRAAPPVQAPPEDAGVLSKLIDESVAQAKHGCPNCHARMKQDQILCVKCGFNMERGKQLQTVVKKAVEERGPRGQRPRGTGGRWFENPLIIGGGLVALFGSLFAVAFFGGEESHLIFLGPMILFDIVVGLSIFVAMIREEAWIHMGLGFVTSGAWKIVWAIFINDNAMLKMMALVSVVNTIGAILLPGVLDTYLNGR